MSHINTVALSGRATRDPELRHTNSGTAVCNFGIAVERYKKDADNETSFFNLTAWSGLAELIARKMRKGDAISIQGALEQRSWEDNEGNKRSTVEVTVREIDGDFIFKPADSVEPLPDAETPSAEPVAAVAADDDIPF